MPRDRRVGGVKQKVVTTTAQVHVDATSDEISVIPNTPEPKRPRKSQGMLSLFNDIEKKKMYIWLICLLISIIHTHRPD